MTDYLNPGGDDNMDSGGDWLSPGVGLDDPAPPTAPDLAIPSAPEPADAYHDAGSYLGSDDYSSANTNGGYDDWQMQEPAHEEISGGYLDSGAPSYYDEPVAGQAAPAPQYNPQMQAAPAAPVHNELSVQAPYLETVYPSPTSVGGTRGDLSELVLDVEVNVEVCFGDAALTVEEFLEMGRGSVVELDHAVDAPVELRVKGRLVARGQLVTISGNYGLRITEMLGAHD